MLISALVVAFSLVAAWTDFRWHKIYNWTTYTGTLMALAIHALS